MIVHDVRQRSDQWHALRCGRFTASQAAAMLSQGKGNAESVGRRDLRLQIVCERLTGQSQDDAFVSPAMQRGTEKEADAFAAYEALTGNVATSVGFVSHDTLLAGCSPDGVIGVFEGLLELKCPKTATHLYYLRSKTVPKDYLAQIHHALWITGAQWCDFVSFDDRLPAHLQVVHLRVPRVEVDITAYQLAARLFLSEVDAEVAALSSALVEA